MCPCFQSIAHAKIGMWFSCYVALMLAKNNVNSRNDQMSENAAESGGMVIMIVMFKYQDLSA